MNTLKDITCFIMHLMKRRAVIREDSRPLSVAIIRHSLQIKS